jgi:hypothetical protein
VPPSGPVQPATRDLAYVLSTLNARGAGILPPTATQVCALRPPSLHVSTNHHTC